MEREFKGVWIPAEIWLDKRLTLVEKALLAEVDSFTGNGKSFHKCNETIQTEYGISRNTIARAFRKLQELEFVEVNFNGRVRHVRVRVGSIPKMGRQSTQNGEAASPNDTSTNTKERTRDNTSKHKGVVMPFEDKEFLEAWKSWKDYKKTEHGFKFKSPTSEQASLHQLQTLSGGDCANAVRIIGQSLANGWKGFFALKNQTNETRRPGPSDGSLIKEHLRRLANDPRGGME